MAVTQYSTAIGVVVHFENNKTAEENSLPERFFFKNISEHAGGEHRGATADPEGRMKKNGRFECLYIGGGRRRSPSGHVSVFKKALGRWLGAAGRGAAEEWREGIGHGSRA